MIAKVYVLRFLKLPSEKKIIKISCILLWHFLCVTLEHGENKFK